MRASLRQTRERRGLAALVALALLLPAAMAASEDNGYAAELAAWRQRADEGLRRERGWLSIIGRWELEPGTTRIGSDAGSDIRLPSGLAASHVGAVVVHDGNARFVLAAGQSMQTVERGKPANAFGERELFAGSERVEWVTQGRLSLQFVKRDDGRFVLRAADRDAPARTAFAGRVWYAPDAGFRVAARFIAKPAGTKIPIVNVRGEVSDEVVAGELHFSLGGRDIRLDALDDDGDLFVIFRDATSGDTTYPPGRFLSIAKPADGQWTIDFNKAYNPPCAFSAYTTCPLPPPQNVIDARIPAGERYVEAKP